MADTYSSNLKVRLLETGAYNNVWGAVHNSDSINLLDIGIAGRATIALGSSTTHSLQALGNGTASDSRAAILTVTGTPASMVTMTVPASVVTKLYVIDNQCGQIIRLGYATGVTVDIAAATRRLVETDGVVPGVYAVFASASDATTIGGVALSSLARLDVANVFAKRNSSPFITVTENPTTTIDSSLGNHFILTLTGNRTIAAPTSPVDGQSIMLIVQQDGTGGRTLTWNSVFLFEDAAPPVLASTAGALDLFVGVYNAALTKWILGHFGNIAAGGGAAYTYSIDENTVDWNLLARVGSPGGAITVSIAIQPGIVIQALSIDQPGMDLSGLPVGSTVNLVNAGYVLGRGGRGGGGAVVVGGITLGGTVGEAGGDAIKGPGSGNNFNVTNVNGHIWGGGGGGGSGSVTGNPGAGGGGGGGVGGGQGGHALGAHPGNIGGTGINGDPGAGGAPSAANANAGASGGDWGEDGVDGSGTVGGDAGKAINLNGGTVTFISGGGSPNVKGATV